MRVSIRGFGESGRVQLDVDSSRTPWRVRCPGEGDVALLDPGPGTPAFVAGGYPEWLRALCPRIDADRVLAEAVVAEVERQS